EGTAGEGRRAGEQDDDADSHIAEMRYVDSVPTTIVVRHDIDADLRTVRSTAIGDLPTGNILSADFACPEEGMRRQRRQVSGKVMASPPAPGLAALILNG